MQRLCLTHKTGGNNQVHHANALVVQHLHLRHQRPRTPAELGTADQHRGDEADIAFPS